MKVNIGEFYTLAGIIKASQQQPRKRRSQKHKYTPAAYPDYSRSLHYQSRQNPSVSGITRAAGTGGIGAILSALLARLYTDDPRIVGGAALAGGAAGAIPGYMSGKQEAVSENSRINFLRRLGITSPGELETMQSYPELTGKVTEEGIRI